MPQHYDSTWIDSKVAARLRNVLRTSTSTSGAHARSHTTRGQHMQRIRGQAPSNPASTMPLCCESTTNCGSDKGEMMTFLRVIAAQQNSLLRAELRHGRFWLRGRHRWNKQATDGDVSWDTTIVEILATKGTLKPYFTRTCLDDARAKLRSLPQQVTRETEKVPILKLGTILTVKYVLRQARQADTGQSPALFTAPVPASWMRGCSQAAPTTTSQSSRHTMQVPGPVPGTFSATGGSFPFSVFSFGVGGAGGASGITPSRGVSCMPIGGAGGGTSASVTCVSSKKKGMGETVCGTPHVGGS